jgi:acyl-CoA thioester hydrolase
MKFTNKQYVRWDDLDAFGHVNNANYLTYAQEARFVMTGMFEMVVARAEVDFVAPIYDGNIFLDVDIWVKSIGTSSFILAYEIKNGGTRYGNCLVAPERNNHGNGTIAILKMIYHNIF